MRRFTCTSGVIATLLACAAHANASECEYFFGFEDRGEELAGWSSNDVSETPVGGRHYLGEFGNETVTLNVNLPANTSVVVLAFDLFVIGGWDGVASPALFDFTIDGSNTLALTTFSNSAQDPQNYPNPYLGGDVPARTGAVENNTLGYGGFGDSVYNFFYFLPHGGGAFSMSFTVSGLSQDIEAASWGLDNVDVCAIIPEPGSLSLLSLGGLFASRRRGR